MNVRVLPPPAGSPFMSMSAFGRSYTGVPGTAQDVPAGDANVLAANGWTALYPSGPTSARPSGDVGQFPARRGCQYYDTDLSKVVTWDGASWRDATGASV